MSNHHYGDQSGCKSDCTRRNDYHQGEKQQIHTDIILDRFPQERSTWDQMYNDYRTKGVPIKFVDGTKIRNAWNRRN